MEIDKWPFDTEFQPQVGDQIKLIYTKITSGLIFDLKKDYSNGRLIKDEEYTIGKTYTVLRSWFVMDGINTDQVQIMSDLGEPIWLYAIHFKKVSNSYRFITE